jgi:hypothetical protein
MANQPVPCSKETLLALLDDIRHHVEANDSFEGYLEYLMPIPEEGQPDFPEDTDFLIKAGYRIGNSMGQGGFRTVGKMV